MKTLIIVDSKLMAYTASYQRRAPLVETLNFIETTIKFMVDTFIIQGNYEVIMGFDFGKSRYRKELLGSYKGHRTEGLKDKPLAEQEAYNTFQDEYRYLLPKMVDALGIRVLGVQGVEFDDLGSIAAHRFHKNYKVILLTEDRDFLQLPLELSNVVQFMPKSYTLVDYNKAVEIEGATNRLEFLVKKAILGDSGDSIRGIHQCGKKCFTEWFENHKGNDYPIEVWKELFIELASSNKKFKIHSNYSDADLDDFGTIFDLNISLGQTMQDLTLLNSEEKEQFLECFTKSLVYDRENLIKICSNLERPLLNDFGDILAIPTYPYIRGVGNGC